MKTKWWTYTLRQALGAFEFLNFDIYIYRFHYELYTPQLNQKILAEIEKSDRRSKEKKKIFNNLIEISYKKKERKKKWKSQDQQNTDDNNMQCLIQQSLYD